MFIYMYQIQLSKSDQLPFDQGVQIVIRPRTLASLPELSGALSDSILHQSQRLL